MFYIIFQIKTAISIDINGSYFMNSYIYIFIQNSYFLFTKSFNALPALKTGAFDAGILISSLVCGFLPFLAALFLTSKDPNPTS